MFPLLSRVLRQVPKTLLIPLLSACGDGSLNETGPAISDPGGAPERPPPPFVLLEATVADIHAAFAGHQLTEDGDALTCVALAEAYLDRIARLDNTVDTGLPINSLVSLNPHWREQAEALDKIYDERGLSGPLHCVPVMLKDLYDTFDFPTTASSRALEGSQPPDDATSVAGLRAAGALILGKAGMSEYAYWTQSFNSVTQRIGSPYDTAVDAGGSSGGSAAAIAANFALVGTGSDTCASIRLPPSNQSLVGVRSSVGLVSQDGLVPLSHSQDVGGPVTRTVRDAALVLDAMASVDLADPATLDPERVQPATYTAFLDPGGLTGKRIGVLRSYGSTDAFGDNTDVNAVIEQALADLAAAGAEIVDPVKLPDFVANSINIITMEFADHLDEYLASFEAPRANTLAVFTSGLVHPFIEALIGASLLLRDTDSTNYRAILDQREATRRYVESELDRLGLDALVYPPVSQPALPTGQVQGITARFPPPRPCPQSWCPLASRPTSPRCRLAWSFSAGNGMRRGYSQLHTPTNRPRSAAADRCCRETLRPKANIHLPANGSASSDCGEELDARYCRSPVAPARQRRTYGLSLKR